MMGVTLQISLGHCGAYGSEFTGIAIPLRAVLGERLVVELKDYAG